MPISLKEYIDAQRKKNIPDETIKKDLINAGHNEENIDLQLGHHTRNIFFDVFAVILLFIINFPLFHIYFPNLNKTTTILFIILFCVFLHFLLKKKWVFGIYTLGAVLIILIISNFFTFNNTYLTAIILFGVLGYFIHRKYREDEEYYSSKWSIMNLFLTLFLSVYSIIILWFKILEKIYQEIIHDTLTGMNLNLLPVDHSFIHPVAYFFLAILVFNTPLFIDVYKKRKSLDNLVALLANPFLFFLLHMIFGLGIFFKYFLDVNNFIFFLILTLLSFGTGFFLYYIIKQFAIKKRYLTISLIFSLFGWMLFCVNQTLRYIIGFGYTNEEVRLLGNYPNQDLALILFLIFFNIPFIIKIYDDNKKKLLYYSLFILLYIIFKLSSIFFMWILF